MVSTLLVHLHIVRIQHLIRPRWTWAVEGEKLAQTCSDMIMVDNH
jgi:hypothetical protein